MLEREKRERGHIPGGAACSQLLTNTPEIRTIITHVTAYERWQSVPALPLDRRRG